MNVKVGEHDGQDVFIHTVILGEGYWNPLSNQIMTQKPILVLIHGWGSSSALFFKIFKKLCKHFCLILIDIPGMGSSSRPLNYPYKTISPEDTITYFVNYLEAWRKQMGDLTNFYLSGHSFGGYLSGNWALRHPKHFKKLILLSPVGIKKEQQPCKIANC